MKTGCWRSIYLNEMESLLTDICHSHCVETMHRSMLHNKVIFSFLINGSHLIFLWQGIWTLIFIS